MYLEQKKEGNDCCPRLRGTLRERKSLSHRSEHQVWRRSLWRVVFFTRNCDRETAGLCAGSSQEAKKRMDDRFGTTIGEEKYLII